MNCEISRPGKLVVLEGPDGSGKTTAAQYVTDLLEARGETVVRVRLPGGTATGEAIRSFFKANATYLPIEEQISLLMLANRQALIEVVWPALDKGHYVVCDRFMDSLYAYQWAGFCAFDPAIKQRITDSALIYGVDVTPDLKIVLDCDADVAAQRMAAERGVGGDVLDSMANDFKQRVLVYYRNMLKESCHGTTVGIDTSAGLKETQLRLRNLIGRLCYDEAISAH